MRHVPSALIGRVAEASGQLASGVEVVLALPRGRRGTRGWAGRLARAYLGDRSGLEAVDRATLLERMRHGEVLVLDVRPAAEYAARHIAGARSVPVDELRRRLHSLPDDRPIIAYCRGPYCVYADEAVRELSEHGLRAARLQDRFPEWKHAGLPVATGHA